jgi:pilus assembly protein Flp/PilA
MSTAPHRTRRFRADEAGTTAIEYALIASLIAVAAIAGMTALGDGTNGSWGKTANKVSGAMK